MLSGKISLAGEIWPRCVSVHLNHRFLSTQRKRSHRYQAMSNFKSKIGVESGASLLRRDKRNVEKWSTNTKCKHARSRPQLGSLLASLRKIFRSWSEMSPGKSALGKTSSSGWPRENLNNESCILLDHNWAKIQRLSTNQNFIISAKLTKKTGRIEPWNTTNT